jgi:hypothetical protein
MDLLSTSSFVSIVACYIASSIFNRIFYIPKIFESDLLPKHQN